MIKIRHGECVVSGDYGEFLADVMTMCNAFIKETMNEFNVSEDKAINAFSKMTGIVKDNFPEIDKEKATKQINEFLAYLTEYGEEGDNVVIIKTEISEDAMGQLKRFLKDIMEMEGEE